MKAQTVIVTGASTGIGRAIAGLFLERRHRVVMNSVHAENLDRTSRELGSPADGVPVPGDVGQQEIGTVLVEHAIAGFPATAPVSIKGGIHALTRQLAAEFGANNIRVNTIAPGIIRSPLQGKIGVDNADALAGLHLLNRIGEPQDIAEMVYLLATSSFITGETINVDGGHVAGHKFA